MAKRRDEDHTVLIRLLKREPRLRTGKLLADHPVMRKVAEIERQLRELQSQKPASKTKSKSKRGAPIKLTPDEIERGIAKVQREAINHLKTHPRRLTQEDALRVLRGMKRDGKPINVRRSTWLRHVVRPALRDH